MALRIKLKSGTRFKLMDETEAVIKHQPGHPWFQLMSTLQAERRSISKIQTELTASHSICLFNDLTCLSPVTLPVCQHTCSLVSVCTSDCHYHNHVLKTKLWSNKNKYNMINANTLGR